MKNVVFTPSAPAPIGPYSQAIEAGGFVFVSGQIAIDPVTGNLYSGDDIQAETRVVMENLKAIITQAGCSMKDVVKCTIFLTDMNNFAQVNTVYGEYFPEYAPARETVAVVGLPTRRPSVITLPGGALPQPATSPTPTACYNSKCER